MTWNQHESPCHIFYRGWSYQIFNLFIFSSEGLATVVGWGYADNIETRLDLAEKLRKVEVQTLNLFDCKAILSGLDPPAPDRIHERSVLLFCQINKIQYRSKFLSNLMLTEKFARSRL